MRTLDPFTQFDFNDDISLDELSPKSATRNPSSRFRGPFPIFNCALNLGSRPDLSVKTRHSASFILTQLHCGTDRESVGFAKTTEFSGGIRVGQAISISGAAASPNMGYNTSPLVAFLLTIFNLRLGWWFPNPSRRNRSAALTRWSLPLPGCIDIFAF